MTISKNMTDDEMIGFVCYLSKTLPEHQRKELAILLMSTTLSDMAVEQVAGFMVGIKERKYDC